MISINYYDYAKVWLSGYLLVSLEGALPVKLRPKVESGEWWSKVKLGTDKGKL